MSLDFPDDLPQEVGQPVPRPAYAHPDDLAVDAFARAMKQRLAEKRRAGRGGWDHPTDCSNTKLSHMLHANLRQKGDATDVANYAMMIHQRAARGLDDETTIHPDWPSSPRVVRRDALRIAELEKQLAEANEVATLANERAQDAVAGVNALVAAAFLTDRAVRDLVANGCNPTRAQKVRDAGTQLRDALEPFAEPVFQDCPILSELEFVPVTTTLHQALDLGEVRPVSEGRAKAIDEALGLTELEPIRIRTDELPAILAGAERLNVTVPAYVRGVLQAATPERMKELLDLAHVPMRITDGSVTLKFPGIVEAYGWRERLRGIVSLLAGRSGIFKEDDHG